MTKPPSNKRQVKAWALVWKDDGRLGAGGVTNTLYDIFESHLAAKKEKAAHKEYHKGLRVVPCTITYTLPRKGRK